MQLRSNSMQKTQIRRKREKGMISGFREQVKRRKKSLNTYWIHSKECSVGGSSRQQRRLRFQRRITLELLLGKEKGTITCHDGNP
jgi:hypothetical protein